MRIWVTRTEPQASSTAWLVGNLGHAAIKQPVLSVHLMENARLDLNGVGGIAFTSTNGVDFFDWLYPTRPLNPAMKVYTTGKATAEQAQHIGYDDVRSADGDLRALASLILQDPPVGDLLWPSAATPAGDLAAMVAPKVVVRWVAVYRTEPVLDPPPAEMDAILIHSPRAAKVVAGLVSRDQAARLALFAISPAAAAPLADLPFARVSVAPRPDETALLSLLPA